jgi:hypothetical protein
MRRISTVLGLAVLMAAAVVLTAGAALARAETETRIEHIPLSGEIAVDDNPFTGDFIYYEATLHVAHHTTYAPDGSTYTTYNTTLQGYGIGGESGARYVILQGDHIRGIYHEDTGMYIQTNNVPIKFLRQGQGGDVMARSVYHITLQPDGTYTAVVENFDYQCI